VSARYTLSGSDLEVQAGYDFRRTASFTIGPYVGMNVGSYTHFRERADWRRGDADIDLAYWGRATHEWVVLGARGTFTTASW